jgi:hypothetical protein
LCLCRGRYSTNLFLKKLSRHVDLKELLSADYDENLLEAFPALVHNFAFERRQDANVREMARQ